MAVRKIKGSWWVDFQLRYQRHRYRSPYNTREGALALEARLRNELTTHGEIKSLTPKVEAQRSAPTLEEFAPRWIEGYVAINNRPKEQKQKFATLRRHLIPCFGKLRLDKITIELLERYKGTKQKEGLHPKTINNHLVILHKLLVTAKDWSLIETVPHVKQLKVPDPPFRHLSRVETEKLLSVIPDEPWRSMVMVAVRTGLRYSEISGLQWEDVDLQKGVITVRRSLVEGEMGNTKNNRIRHIPLTPDLLSTLIASKSPVGSSSPLKEGSRLPSAGRGAMTRPPSLGSVFLFQGSAVKYKTAQRRLEYYSNLAGIEHISWHDLRHTFASQLVATSAPILAVQKLLGHADIKMTMRYSHLEPDVLRGVVDRLDSSSAEKYVNQVSTAVPS